MKTIGLIGGMSWESTVPYYRVINETVRARLGGLHSAKIILYSVDFHDIEHLQRAGDWPEAGRQLAQAARSLELAGADCLVLCTNTMHRVAPAIEEAVTIPFFHIADPTAEEITRSGLVRVGLLGTRFTMEEDFYRGRLESRHGLSVLTPPADARTVVHGVIYKELCLGTVRGDSRTAFRHIVADLVERGAEGVILGCTEIGLLLRPEDAPVPMFDTATIHAEAAAEFALGG